MQRIYLPTQNMITSMCTSVKIFMEDIIRLDEEGVNEFKKYIADTSNWSALFKARAKFIEQSLLLGVSAEYLLKAVLLKCGYIINKEKAGKKFSKSLFDKIEELGSKQSPNEFNLIYQLAEKELGPVSGETIGLKKCIDIFQDEIVGDADSYYSDLPNKEYKIINSETKEFYGEIINYSNALEKIRLLRNNYAHLPDPMYEERGLVPFLYNFLVFIAKKEFPEKMENLQIIACT